jgi:hypothetical protein
MGLKNSSSTKPSEYFTKISATNQLNDKVAELQSTGPNVTNTLPAIAMGTIEQSNQEVSTYAIYTFTYYTINEMGVGACFNVTYPSYVSPELQLTTVQVVYKSQTYPMGWSIDATLRNIQLKRGLPKLIPAGSKLQLIIGLLKNPESQLKTGESFVITSFTDATFKYQIDQVVSGLVPGFKCSYPCASCPSKTQPSVCLSCFTTIAAIPEKYLNGTKCLATCPANTQSNALLNCLAIHTKYLALSTFVSSAQPAYYSFQLTPTGTVPATAYVTVTIPPEVQLMTGETAVACESTAYNSPWQRHLNQGVVTLEQSTPQIVLRIDNIFQVEVTFG